MDDLEKQKRIQQISNDDIVYSRNILKEMEDILGSNSKLFEKLSDSSDVYGNNLYNALQSLTKAVDLQQDISSKLVETVKTQKIYGDLNEDNNKLSDQQWLTEKRRQRAMSESVQSEKDILSLTYQLQSSLRAKLSIEKDIFELENKKSKFLSLSYINDKLDLLALRKELRDETKNLEQIKKQVTEENATAVLATTASIINKNVEFSLEYRYEFESKITEELEEQNRLRQQAAATPAPQSSQPITPPTPAQTNPNPANNKKNKKQPRFANRSTPASSSGAMKTMTNEVIEAIKNNGKLDEGLRSSLNSLRSTSKIYDEINAKISVSRDLNKDLKSLQADLEKSLATSVKIETELSTILQKNPEAVYKAKEIKDQYKTLLDEELKLQIKLNEAIRDSNDLNSANVISAKKELNSKVAEIELLKESVEVDTAKALALLQINDINEKTTEQLKEQYVLEKYITQQLGIGGNAMKGLYNVLNKVGLGSFLKMDEITKSMRKAAEDGKNKWQVLGAGIKASFASIGDTLRDPLVIIGGLVAAMKSLINLSLQYQSKQFEAAKSLGMSVTESASLLNNFNNIAKSNSSLAMTAKQLVESYSQINNQLGFIGPSNAEFLTTTTGIQRRIGATAEDMLSLQYASVKTGKTLQQTYQSTIGIAKQTGATLKFNMSEKQILEGISKVSATVFNNFKGNVAQLAKAVVTATKFGTTLDSINAQGDTLLDYESSMAKQFEAQLLTGQDIDLTRSRELALLHDTDGLMKELNGKLMEKKEFERLNTLEQQSYAEALGLSRDTVNEMYKKQELNNILGDAAGKSLQTQYNELVRQGRSYDYISEKLGEQAAIDATRSSTAEKMAATMENIKDSIGKMTEGLAAFVDKFAAFIGDADNLKTILKAVGGLMGAIVGYSIAISVQKQRQLAIELQLQFAQTRLLAGIATQMGGNAALIAQEETQMILGKKNAIIGVGEAVTKTTAASGALGPGALLVGAAVGAGLMALLSSYGISGGGGGSAASVGMPAIPAAIKPMNTAAATNGNSQATQEKMLGRPIVIENKVYSEIKADNKTIAVASNTGNDQSAHTDRKTGYYA